MSTIWEEYLKYLAEWIALHKNVKHAGRSPMSFGEWYTLNYATEDEDPEE